MEYKTNHKVVVEVLKELNKIEGIDMFTVSDEAVNEITRLLKLEKCKDVEELRAIRNSVVMIYSAFNETITYWNIGSAITAVIDKIMVSKFGTL